MAGWLILSDCANPFNDKPFDRKTWLNEVARPETRIQMDEDLTKRVLRPGMPENSVSSLLGAPYQEFAAENVDTITWREGDRKALVYELGRNSRHLNCSHFLYVVISHSGRVTHNEIFDMD